MFYVALISFRKHSEVVGCGSSRKNLDGRFLRRLKQFLGTQEAAEWHSDREERASLFDRILELPMESLARPTRKDRKIDEKLLEIVGGPFNLGSGLALWAILQLLSWL